MAESAPGFETRAHIGKADDVVTRRNAREQGDCHQKNGHQTLSSGGSRGGPPAFGKEHGRRGGARHEKPDQI